MGVVSTNTTKSNMKFLGVIALVGLVSANNFNSDLKAAQNALKQNGIDQQKLTNARNKAEDAVKGGLSKAEKYAKQNGITIDFTKIFNDLNTKYGTQVEKAVSDAAAAGKKAYNANRNKVANVQNNADVQKATNLAKTANFQRMLNQAHTAINAQINTIGNAEVKDNLKALVKNAKKQAKTELNNAGLTGNVLKKAEQEFNNNNGQQKVDAWKNNILAQAKAAAAQLD